MDCKLLDKLLEEVQEDFVTLATTHKFSIFFLHAKKDYLGNDFYE